MDIKKPSYFTEKPAGFIKLIENIFSSATDLFGPRRNNLAGWLIRVGILAKRGRDKRKNTQLEADSGFGDYWYHKRPVKF